MKDCTQEKKNLKEYFNSLGLSVTFKTRTSRTGWKTLFCEVKGENLYWVRQWNFQFNEIFKENFQFNEIFKENFPDYFGVTSSCGNDCTIRLTMSESEVKEAITKKIDEI